MAYGHTGHAASVAQNLELFRVGHDMLKLSPIPSGVMVDPVPCIFRCLPPQVTSVTTIENQPVQFLSSASSSTPQASQSIEHAEGPSGEGCSTTTDHSNSSADAAKSRDASDFSLEGVLKLAESTGYVFKSPQVKLVL